MTHQYSIYAIPQQVVSNSPNEAAGTLLKTEDAWQAPYILPVETPVNIAHAAWCDDFERPKHFYPSREARWLKETVPYLRHLLDHVTVMRLRISLAKVIGPKQRTQSLQTPVNPKPCSHNSNPLIDE
ncbi:hypothetical protein SLE2022_081870 [Rubroshorea leprosula]